jgi:hypothetical protein
MFSGCIIAERDHLFEFFGFALAHQREEDGPRSKGFTREVK